MKPLELIFTLNLAFGSLAQTPVGFSPSVGAHLDVIFGTKVVAPPGTALSKSETSRQPTIGTSTSINGTYLWMMIGGYFGASRWNLAGLNLHYSSTNFANPKAGQPATYLHTVLRDFKATGQTTDSGVFTLSTKATGPVSWFAPAPPAETPPHPHRYTNLLWEQPANWVISQDANSLLQNKRSGFNVTDFQRAAGLKDPIFANYFNVTG